MQRQRQAAQAPGQLARLLAAGIGYLGGQVPEHLGARRVVQRPQFAQRDPGAPDARIPDPGGHDHHPGRVGPQPPGAVGRGARVGTGQHRRVIRPLEHQQPAAARAVIGVEELPGPVRRGLGAFAHRARHRLRRPELPEDLEHSAGQLGRVRRPDPPDAVAALAGHPGRGQRDGRLAQAAHAGDHERPAGPPRVGPQGPAQLPGQRLAPAYLGRQLAERRRDRQRGRKAARYGRGGGQVRRRRGHPPGQARPRRHVRLLDLALHVLEDRRVDPPVAVPHHVVVDVVGHREDHVGVLGGQPGLDHRRVEDPRGRDHGLPGEPLGVLADRPDVQRDPQLDPHHLAGPAVVLTQPVGQLDGQRVDHAQRGDHRRHHDDGAVTAVLAVAGRPRHSRRLEGGPQDLVQRRAHHVTVAVVAQRIGEPGHVGEHDRAVQRLMPGTLPLCFLGLRCFGGWPRGRFRRDLAGAVRRPGGERTGFVERGVAEGGEAAQVDDGQPAGPLAAGDDPPVPPRAQEPANRVRARPGPVRQFLLRHRQGEHRTWWWLPRRWARSDSSQASRRSATARSAPASSVEKRRARSSSRRSVTWRSSTSAARGWPRRNSANRSAGITIADTSSSAVTVADRTPAVSAARSPMTSP